MSSGPFPSSLEVGILLLSGSVDTYSWVVFRLGLASLGENLLPMTDAVGDLCIVGNTHYGRKAHFELTKNYFLPVGITHLFLPARPSFPCLLLRN